MVAVAFLLYNNTNNDTSPVLYFWCQPFLHLSRLIKSHTAAGVIALVNKPVSQPCGLGFSPTVWHLEQLFSSFSSLGPTQPYEWILKDRNWNKLVYMFFVITCQHRKGDIKWRLCVLGSLTCMSGWPVSHFLSYCGHFLYLYWEALSFFWFPAESWVPPLPWQSEPYWCLSLRHLLSDPRIPCFNPSTKERWSNKHYISL